MNTELDSASYHIESHWLGEDPTPRTLLVVYAHPDDESFGSAGVIARYAGTGTTVHYICATRGECGTVAPAVLAKSGYSDIGALRSAELMCAAQALGLRSVHYLGYRDSGMPGAADNQHSNAFMNAPLEQVSGQVVGLIRLLRPQVVLTFGSYGGYGHPDHIKIHEATVVAFKAANDPTRYPEQISAGLGVWQPSKLYFNTFGTTWLKLGIRGLRLIGRDPRKIGENKDVDIVKAAEQATPITTSLDCGAYLEQKERAWRCHHSQAGDLGRTQKLPRPIRRLLFGTEHLTRAIPAWPDHHPKEHDLFS